MTSIALKDGIRLYSGALFDYQNPANCVVDIEDIAHGLSHICRYAGQCRWFYSVAQHAVNASCIVSPDHAFDALMHDTAEAFTNDLPRPMKMFIPGFKQLEGNIEGTMAKRFGFNYPLSPEVARADDVMLALEKPVLLPNDRGTWQILDYLGDCSHLALLVDLDSWTPAIAKKRFLERYEELRP